MCLLVQWFSIKCWQNIRLKRYKHGAAVAKVGVKKLLTKKYDIEKKISNQGGRLICNAIVYYNSAILSRLLERQEAEDTSKVLRLWPCYHQ